MLNVNDVWWLLLFELTVLFAEDVWWLGLLDAELPFGGALSFLRAFLAFLRSCAFPGTPPDMDK